MGCFFRWTPYQADSRMGLNHQMSSLSCAINEASYLGRTIMLPSVICTDSGHNRKGEACPAFESLFDVGLLTQLHQPGFCIGAGCSGNGTDAGFTTLPRGCDSACAQRRYPCGTHPLLERHQPGFWFEACLRHSCDTEHLARRTEALLGLPSGSYDAETAPSLALLRSGLFYSRALKATARKIRRSIGRPYSSIHLRRSDKLRAGGASQAASRDLATQSTTVLRLMHHWATPGSTLYIGSTEPPPFFAPLASAYDLVFASNFSRLLQDVTNNYAKYAVESLVFVGSELYVETYGYTRGNYMRGCFPYMARERTAAVPRESAKESGQAAVFGVVYGRACSRTCHEDLHLIPSPPKRPCRRREAFPFLAARKSNSFFG